MGAGVAGAGVAVGAGRLVRGGGGTGAVAGAVEGSAGAATPPVETGSGVLIGARTRITSPLVDVAGTPAPDVAVPVAHAAGSPGVAGAAASTRFGGAAAA
ncbi:hypothetical protein, partial [Micromonospora sp. NPDC023633]|uniref:hypothetical protein n=1 Tax=Micromonospora sp. NPDC023633 TaxID=3154320 RepID=UPI0033D33FC5